MPESHPPGPWTDGGQRNRVCLRRNPAGEIAGNAQSRSKSEDRYRPLSTAVNMRCQANLLLYSPDLFWNLLRVHEVKSLKLRTTAGYINVMAKDD